MEQIKLLGMTVVITIFIWVGADSLVNQVVTVPIAFEVLPAANTNMLIEIDPAAKSQYFEAQLAGPRRNAEVVQARDEPYVVRLRVGDLPSGSSAISLDKDMVERAMSEQFHELRKLSVVAIKPASLPAIVDRMVDADVDIVLRRLTLSYDDEPQLKRTVTSVRMRESVRDALIQSEQRLQIDIATDVERLLRSKPRGKSTTIQVALNTAQFGPDAVLNPDTIDVTATVRADRDTAEIPTVPIKPVVSFANLDKAYVAVGRDSTPLTLVTQTIRVSGPTEDVASLIRGETRAYGFIHLKEADLAELDVFKAWTPQFQLPPNIELAGQPEPIEFKLTSVSHTGPGE